MAQGKIEPIDLFSQPNARAKRPLIIWMMEHHNEMVALIRHHRISWQFATERFTAAGFTAASHRPLKPETVRSYWKRAQKYVAHERAIAAKQTPPVSTQTPPASPRASNPQTTGFLPIEPENTEDPDDIFSRPLPTISLRNQPTKSSLVTAAEKSANLARDNLAATRSSLVKPKE